MLVLHELDLEIVHAQIAEGAFRRGEIELPHAAEALVIEFPGTLAVVGEAQEPFTQCLGIVQSEDLDVGDVESGLLDMRQHFRERGNVTPWEDVLLDPCGRRIGPG